ncbi:DUF3325 domain-containing protein [Paracoccus aminovorans]|uniref:DUF3325 domain-containing protein n=1 Tax=Paracoccus aminovorans TaxID=34004 RepID=UPI002B25ED9E|nr:DUF3325 domain-containing protein [Paracoccus aminovorans]
MTGWMSLGLALLGFASLALAMPHHHQQVLRRPISRHGRWGWRLTGSAFLGLSLLLSCLRWPDPVIAVTAWLGILTLAAFAVGMALTARARHSARRPAKPR